MKNTFFATVVCFCFSVSLFAQNIERENMSIRFVRKPLKLFPDSTETYYIQFSPHTTALGNNFCQQYEADEVQLYGYYRLNNVDDADIIISSAINADLIVTDTKMKSGKFTYKKDKNSPEINYVAYFYVISIKTPELYYAVKTGSGTSIENGVLGGAIQTKYFGGTSYDDHYSSEYQLAAAWREIKSSYQKQWEQDAYATSFGYVRALYTTYCLHTWLEKFSIKYVKEKKENNYQDLRDAKNKFAEAVSYMNTDSIYLINKLVQPDYDKRTALLKESIDIWEKAVAEADYKNKKARIDQKVARHLYYNLAAAYLLLDDFNKAQQKIQGRQDEETDKVLLKNAFAGIQTLSSFIDDQKKRHEANTWRPLLASYNTTYIYKTPAEKEKEKQLRDIAEKKTKDSLDALNRPKKTVTTTKKKPTPASAKKTTIPKPAATTIKKPN